MAEAKPIHWAADLVKALKATFTGQAKLDLIRTAMAARFHAPEHADKKDDHPDRHLTAAEAIAVLEKSGVGEVTLEKARTLAETGMWNKPAAVNPADALPSPPTGPAPDREMESGTLDALKRTVDALKPIAGVTDLSTAVDTVGLKPVEVPPVGKKNKGAAGKDKKDKGAKKDKDKGGTSGVKDLLPATEPTSGGEPPIGATEPTGPTE